MRGKREQGAHGGQRLTDEQRALAEWLVAEAEYRCFGTDGRFTVAAWRLTHPSIYPSV